MSERAKHNFSKSLKNMVTKTSFRGFAQRLRDLSFDSVIQMYTSSPGNVNGVKEYELEDREIYKAANLFRDFITMFDLKVRHFAAAPPDEKSQEPLSVMTSQI